MAALLFTVLVLNGPNLNMLGSRDPSLYSNMTLAEINDRLITQAAGYNIKLICKQTNSEHELIDMIQTSKEQNVAAIIINAGALSHTSLALADALSDAQLPYIEVHISNIYAREEFRAKSFLSRNASGVITGLGPIGYQLALTAVNDLLTIKSQRLQSN